MNDSEFLIQLTLKMINASILHARGASGELPISKIAVDIELPEKLFGGGRLKDREND